MVFPSFHSNRFSRSSIVFVREIEWFSFKWFLVILWNIQIHVIAYRFGCTFGRKCQTTGNTGYSQHELCSANEEQKHFHPNKSIAKAVGSKRIQYWTAACYGVYGMDDQRQRSGKYSIKFALVSLSMPWKCQFCGQFLCFDFIFQLLLCVICMHSSPKHLKSF